MYIFFFYSCFPFDDVYFCSFVSEPFEGSRDGTSDIFLFVRMHFFFIRVSVNSDIQFFSTVFCEI